MFTGTLSVVMNGPSRLQLGSEIFTCFSFLANLNITQIKTISSKMHHPTSAQHGILVGAIRVVENSTTKL